MEQLNLFNDYPLKAAAKPSPNKKVKAQKPVVTEEMKAFRHELCTADMETFVKLVFAEKGIDSEACVSYYHRNYRCFGDMLDPCGCMYEHVYPLTTKWLLYIDPDGNLWKLNVAHRYIPNYDYRTQTHLDCAAKGIVGEWKKAATLLDEAFVLTPDIEGILEKKNPYAYQFTREYYDENGSVTPRFENLCLALLLAPELEQLYKAGYAFADKLLKIICIQSKVSDIDCFNRLCQPEKSIKKIFKTSRPVYETLKDETDLKLWDSYRKMFKKGSITKECLEDLYRTRAREKELAQYHSILSKEYNGKRIFTWESLQRYIERVDMYQAIERDECLQILQDYLRMCHILDIAPRIDSDSLKREHDTAARICRNKRDELRAEKLNKGCAHLKKYNYEEDVFFIRGVESYDDLIDEAKQQRNCVASYADRIAEKRSFIYFMREKKHPDRSLITVEVNKDGTKIRQAFYACNQRIRNKAQSEFLDRWCKHNRQINAKTVQKTSGAA